MIMIPVLVNFVLDSPERALIAHLFVDTVQIIRQLAGMVEFAALV